MKLKSFFAETIEAAMAQAGKELGAEAMLLNSRRSDPDLQHLGAYEVVCALAPEIQPLNQLQSIASDAAMSLEMVRLREQMEGLARLIAQSGASSAGMTARPELARVYAVLCDAEVSPEVAQDIVLRLSLQTDAKVSARELAAKARSELASFVLTNPVVGNRGNGGIRTVALVGPPGSGKTTSLVKLAIRECLAQRKPCSLFTIDTLRIAAADQLRSYASILGVPFQVIETPASLIIALENLRPNDTAFIDTPGFAAMDMVDAFGWGVILTERPGIDVHLVLPASMRSADQRRIADKFEIFSPRKLLFTKLDETEASGGMITVSLSLRKPISFLSSGQQIPEDLDCAGADEIADRVLRRLEQGESASAAAA